MEGILLFVVACLVIGVLGRMAMGQSAGEATKTTLGNFGGGMKTAGKIAGFGWKVYRRR
ncbi:hypothetical protein GobsT_51250 [Gemmata obscuriglobus]|uniref:hypothetical protein n=1 Tax=Gemmata obscuriglobus TaxID=114 RepID=UPI00016C4AF2|nr:hypothetical protein [Gemmata obscuriglobus]QEG30320.1 hypothetical protein GobsT_51250 [Gemmata obscuriglobus]VTS09644.1 unnamed protein product [Gemmata obscuriglobus UQM 2246]